MLEKDLKLLWGRSGNRCAICRIELSFDAESASESFPLGEQAHIVGEKPNAPRGASSLTPEQRDGYPNRILLCPNDHTKIDKNPKDWPIERLHLIKTEHELYVQRTLSSSVDLRLAANQLIVSSIVDLAVAKCRLTEWKNWTSFALSPHPQWPKGLVDDIGKFREQVIAAVWPEEFDELRRAMVTLSVLLDRASQRFLDHAKLRDDTWEADRFYRNEGRFNPTYNEDVEEFDNWVGECAELLREATKAANWVADVVRRDINPLFFAVEGRFLTVEGPMEDLSFVTRLLQYTDEEKRLLPDALEKKK